MSMAREEVIKRLKELKARCERLSVSSNYTPQKWREDAEAVRMALSALLPVSREQVEKVWRGEWINKHSAYDHKIFTCARCGKQISIQGENLSFCPKCGSAQTDEAVEMVMEKLEALKDG